MLVVYAMCDLATFVRSTALVIMILLIIPRKILNTIFIDI